MRVAFAPSLPDHTCPPPALPGAPLPPPAPIPPGPARDFAGHVFGRSTGAAEDFRLRLDARVGSVDGYGTWGAAVDAASAASAGGLGDVAICDDRGRLYVYTVSAVTDRWSEPLRVGARREAGYAFVDDSVRGIVDGDRTASRGDCLHQWIPVPA